MNVDAHALEETGVLQRLATAHYRMPAYRVVLAEEAGFQGLSHGLLVKVGKSSEAFIGEEGIVSNAKAHAQVMEERVFSSRRQWDAQPFPCIALVHRHLVALDDGKGFVEVRPASVPALAENEVRSSV